MRSVIILDKSFLQGTGASLIQELAATHTLAVSDALFYELLTCSEPVRSRCFRKFPLVDNPVHLVSHIGPLMRREIDEHSPSGKPSEHREEFQFRFNPALVTPEYEVPEQGRMAIEEYTSELHSDVYSFLERAALAHTFFPSLLSGSQAQQKCARAEAEEAIAKPGALLPFYSELKPPAGGKPLPPVHLVSERWAVYRWLQVQMLFAVDVYVRYGGRVPLAPFNAKIFKKMEHDVLDAEVLMLGCLEGALATKERKLQRWWKLLCPQGELHC